MSEPADPLIFDLTVRSLHDAIRRAAVRTLAAPGSLEVADFRAIEPLMRIAIALAGAGSHLPPYVEVHGLPPASGPEALPEIFTVSLTDLLAARAADHLPATLQGDPEALHALQQEADRLLETEDIELG